MNEVMTPNEAAAFIEARTIIGRFLDEPVQFFGPVYALDGEAGTLLVRRMFKMMAQLDTHSLRYVIEFARAGDPDADMALRELYVEKIDRGEPKPVFLEVYMADRHVMPIGQQPPGPKKKNNVLRDILSPQSRADPKTLARQAAGPKPSVYETWSADD